MESLGLANPSALNISINFRTSENEPQILQHICTKPKIMNEGGNTIIEQPFFLDKGAPFMLLCTNLCDRPLKMLIDTGAAVSIVAGDLIKNSIQKNDYFFNLFGIAGKDVSVTTEGMIYGIFNFGNTYLGATLHIVDRKYTGSGDGYLGFDFLAPYRVTMDLNKMCLRINLNNLFKNNEGIEQKSDESVKDDELNKEIEPTFLRILAENYEFETKLPRKTTTKVNMDNIEKNCHEYENAVKSFQSQLKEYEQCSMRTRKVLESIKMNNFANFSKRHEIIYNKLNLNHCSESEKDFVKSICEEFPMQFYLDGDPIGATHVLKHHIRLLPNAKIVNQKQFRIPQVHKKPMQDIVDEYERQGIIEKCQSPYNSPAFLVDKKDDAGGKTDHRLVIDYKKLNQECEILSFPIPRMDETIDRLKGSKYFTIVDMKGAFHQIIVDEKSRDLTAFTPNNYQYRFIRLPFGLSAGPLTWQYAITIILTEYINKGIQVYADDVIFHAPTLEEHNRLLRWGMNRIQEHNMQLKIPKCTFFARNFEYLGHEINEHGIKPLQKKVQAIKDYPRPKNLKEIQRFLGLCGYYRKFVPNFARIAKPITSLLKKDMPFIWADAQQKAFEELKRALMEDVILAFPDFSEEALFYLTTDASNSAIGSCLSQGTLPNDRPIYYFSKTLNEAQRKYSTIEKELLAIVESIKIFRPYLYGRYFVLITDHKPLCYLFNMRNTNSRLFRQKVELMDYNFKILYRPGAQNHVADALSRIEPLTINELIEINNEKEIFVTTRAQSKSSELVRNLRYTVDEKDGVILNKRGFDLIFHLIPEENDVLKNKLMDKFGITSFTAEWKTHKNIHYFKIISNQFANRQNEEKTEDCIREIHEFCNEIEAENIAINIDCDNIRHYLHFKWEYERIFEHQTVATTFFLNKIVELKEREDIDTILNLYHQSLLGGHLGYDKMYKTISRFYHWENMTNDIKNHVKGCTVCEKTKVTLNTKVPMEISSLGEVLFDHCYIDFVGPIQPSASGNKYIFTAVCDLTKFLVAIPTVDCTSLTAAECLLENILCRYNFPSKLISDNASNFTSKVIKDLSNLFATKKIFTTPYHPQANIVERAHRTLNSYLRAYTDRNKNSWDELLKYATFAYNNSVHTTTGYTPHELAHGFRIQIPTQLTKQKIVYNYDSLADLTKNNMAKALELAKEQLYNKKIQNKKYYDSNAKECDIQIGDQVLYKNPIKKHKFQNVYDGPYLVLDAGDSYVEILKENKKVKVHKNMIKKSLAAQDSQSSNISNQIVCLEDLDQKAIYWINLIYGINLN